MSAASVTLDAVRKAYGATDIVKGVSLDIAPGEFLVLVGPSGCGKSTTLRMIAGLEAITGGELRIDGVRVNDTPPKDRDIGMVFQSYALYPHMSVAENIGFGLKLRGAAADVVAARTTDVARMLDITHLLERRPAQLSGGQRQRVAMGRAIARNPRVYLFDEPLSNLDTALRVRMRAELQAMHRRLGTTTVYVTHDQVEAMTLASRVAVLHGGVLEQVGPPQELFAHPRNRFVAEFIGSPRMNVVDGLALDAGALVRAGVRLPLPRAVPAERVAAVGFRPHDARLVRDGAASTFGLRGVTAAVEQMGWEAYAHVDTDAGTVIVRVEGADAVGLDVGAAVHVDVVAERMHAFDAAGLAL